jgi:methionyl-tRNA formyltransferase
LNDPRIVFAGTPEFALASLTALVQAGRNIVAVYTQPDRPAGRGRKLTASPVKRYAEAQGIVVMQPETLRAASAADDLASLQSDIMVVAAYGLILPQNILDIPTQGCLNVHASILPRWRGAAPIQAAILANDASTGVCLMRMTAGLDCGPVYSTQSVTIAADENAGDLHDRLAAIGGELLVTDLQKILQGELTAQEQEESRACYAAKIAKQDALIDWSLSADECHRRIRAYNPNPGAYFFSGEAALRIKIWQATRVPDVKATPGMFVQYDAEAITVACGSDALKLEILQAPGKRRAPAHEFVSQLDIR